MALTVIKRPQGHVLSTTENTATVSSSSGALFTKSTHGLSTGDYIYIYSALSAYNGYWYVQINDANSFRIFEYPTATQQAYVNSGTVTYYVSDTTHGVSCVHLPIIYKLLSTSWPTNSVDSSRTITTFSNYSGYTYIVASGDIKATGTASALEEVVLSGTSVDGVYKILNWFSDTNFVIDLAYSGSNVLSGGTVQYYYFNYHARIKIYAGIKAAHTWQSQKPYELLAEIKAVPDSNGIITVSIEEIVKSKIGVLNNNTILDTLPNNIDAWCNFYISYAESYDDSNMYTVSEYVSSYTDDSGNFEGYAINSKLAFKSIDAGYMSEYVAKNNILISPLEPEIKFLTSFVRPKIFSGYYFDISYLLFPTLYGFSPFTKIDRYANGGLLSSTTSALPSYDDGVYRSEISISGSEDTIGFNVYYESMGDQYYLFETIYIDVNQDCANQNFYLSWLNNLGGFDYWNFTARKTYSVDVTSNSISEKNIYSNWPKSYGAFADTIKQQTSRTSNDVIRISSQFLTVQQEEAIKQILSSPLVQLCTSKYDRRTVIVDPSTYRIRKDQDDLRTISFDLRYTDDIPSQSL